MLGSGFSSLFEINTWQKNTEWTFKKFFKMIITNLLQIKHTLCRKEFLLLPLYRKVERHRLSVALHIECRGSSE